MLRGSRPGMASRRETGTRQRDVRPGRAAGRCAWRGRRRCRPASTARSRTARRGPGCGWRAGGPCRGRGRRRRGRRPGGWRGGSRRRSRRTASRSWRLTAHRKLIEVCLPDWRVTGVAPARPARDSGSGKRARQSPVSAGSRAARRVPARGRQVKMCASGWAASWAAISASRAWTWPARWPAWLPGHRWLPGTPGIPPAAGMLVTMMEYRQPAARSKAVRFLDCRREGFVRRTIHRRPSARAARLIRWVISATCLSSCTTPSWSTAACQAAAGSRGIACSSVISSRFSGVYHVALRAFELRRGRVILSAVYDAPGSDITYVTCVQAPYRCAFEF